MGFWTTPMKCALLYFMGPGYPLYPPIKLGGCHSYPCREIPAEKKRHERTIVQSA